MRVNKANKILGLVIPFATTLVKTIQGCVIVNQWFQMINNGWILKTHFIVGWMEALFQADFFSESQKQVGKTIVELSMFKHDCMNGDRSLRKMYRRLSKFSQETHWQAASLTQLRVCSLDQSQTLHKFSSPFESERKLTRSLPPFSLLLLLVPTIHIWPFLLFIRFFLSEDLSQSQG